MIYRYKLYDFVIELSGEFCPPTKADEIMIERIMTEVWTLYYGSHKTDCWYTKELVLNRITKGGETQSK